MLRQTPALTLAVLIAFVPSAHGEDAATGAVETPPLSTPPAAPGARAASAGLLRNIASTLPKFDPTPAPAGSTANPPAPNPARSPILRLPKYMVRQPRPIEENDVMTAKGREAAIVKRYVGKPSDLDVALNKYTLNTLWKKIPLLGPNSDFATSGSASLTYGERIVLDYSKIEARRRYIEALGVSADVPPVQAKPENAAKPSPPDGK